MQYKAWHKSLKDASGFLHNVAKTHDFGDDHRKEAFMHHKAIDPIMQEDEAVNVHKEESPSEYEEGEEPAQQFGTKQLQWTFEGQNREITELTSQLESVVNCLYARI